MSLSRVRHDVLRELAIETGGLPRSVLREIFLCEFPALEHLELLLGEPNYGFDGTVEDLQPLLAGGLFPRLKFLGLMNSTIANDIAAVLVNSPLVGRIEALDLSMGMLDAEGVKSLMGLGPQLPVEDVEHLASFCVGRRRASARGLSALHRDRRRSARSRRRMEKRAACRVSLAILPRDWWCLAIPTRAACPAFWRRPIASAGSKLA